MEARGGVRCSARLSGEAASARTTSSSGNGAPGRPAIDAAAAALRRARAAERAREVEDSPRVLREKCRRLARALRNAKHLVVYTGAGISTAADIPDYRGPDGVWTRLQRGETVGRVEVSRAQPTFTHMALTALWARGTLKFVVSQNCDGLHLRAGLPRRALAELHGDMFAELCAACRRVYLRAFDTTERTARHAHGTRRLCHTCGAELRDSIVHFGERGRAAWPLNWAGALRHAGRADVVLCLGSSLKVLRRYPRLWRMHAPPRDRPALYIVNLQWTPKDAVAALKINARCDAVMRQVARRLRLRVPRYRADRDPLLAHAEPLQPAEAHTTRRPLLRAPPPPPPPRPSPRHRDDCSAEDFSSPSASDSDEELPLRHLAERLRAPDAKPSPPTSRPSSPNFPNGRHPSPNARSRSPHTESFSPNVRLSSPDREPSLQNTRLPSPNTGRSLPNDPPRSPAVGSPVPNNRLPSPDTESRSRDARLLPPDTGPPPDARLPSPDAEHSSPTTLASQNPKPLSYNIGPSTPKSEPSELTLDSAPQRLYDHSTPPNTRAFVPNMRLPKSEAPPSSIRPPSPSKLSPTSAKRPLPDLLRAFQVSMRSGEATILLRAQHAPPPPAAPPAGPALHALRSFRMVRPRPPLTLNGNHTPKIKEFAIKKEEYLVKKEEYLVRTEDYLVKKEEYLVKKEEADGVKGEEGEGARGLGSRLRRLLECSPRLGGGGDKPQANGDASSGEEGGARALAAAYIARAVLVCRAQLYPGLHTIISPAAAAAAAAPAECAWCHRRHGARRCLWYGPPRCTPADARASRRRQLCACCDAPGAAAVAAPTDEDGGGWYGKGYRKGRRRRR